MPVSPRPAEEYQCTGLLEQDFPELCARCGIAGIPSVTLRPPPSFPEDGERGGGHGRGVCVWGGSVGAAGRAPEPPGPPCRAEEPAEPTLPETLARIQRKFSLFQPRIQVAREPEDPRSVRGVFLRGGAWGPPQHR